MTDSVQHSAIKMSTPPIPETSPCQKNFIFPNYLVYRSTLLNTKDVNISAS